MGRKVGSGQFFVGFWRVLVVTATDVVRKSGLFGQFLAILVSFEKQKWAEKMSKKGLKRAKKGLKWAKNGLFWAFSGVFR